MNKLTKLAEIAREDGFSEALTRSLRFGVSQVPDFIWRPFIIYSLLQNGRRSQDVKFLLENNRDRHDALVGPDRLYSSAYYPVPQTRAQHYYRYVFAANVIVQKETQKEPIRVLDLAAGLSYGTHIFKMKFNSELEYIASDISADALAYGQKYYSPAGSVQADGQHLPFEDNSLDIIVSFETMEHIPDVENYLKELSRVVSPNGDLFFSVPNDEDLDPKEEHNVKEYPHMHAFDYGTFNDTLNNHFPGRNLTVYTQEYPSDVKRPMEIEDLPPGFSEVNEQREIADQSTLLARIN